VTETEKDIKIIQEELVDLGDGLPEFTTGLSAIYLYLPHMFHLASMSFLIFINISLSIHVLTVCFSRHVTLHCLLMS